MDLEKRINEIFNELVEIRRDFHMYPELSEKEFRTSEKICEYLNSWGIEHAKGVAKTGVVAIIRGKKEGITVGTRADIDALPINEDNDLPYKSRSVGIMHACGHDVHTAIQLGVARILKEMEDELQGNVKLFFQPAEETVGGAKQMIEEGYLDNPKVEYMLSLHVTAELDAGYVQFKYGKLNASSNEFSIRVIGKSGHAAYPEKSIDPVVVSSHIVLALQSIISRNISPLNSSVITIGQIHGGVKNNIIPSEVVISGTIRALDETTREFVIKRVKEIAENTASAYGAKAVVCIEDGYPVLANDNEVVDILKEIAEETLGKDKVSLKEYPSLGSDDFSFFLEKARGAYYFLGCGNKLKGWTYPIHSEKFIVDEECIKVGVLLQTRGILRLLNMK